MLGKKTPPVPQRRSVRQRKPPDRYIMHQMTPRPYDSKIQTLNVLLDSGVLDDMDSDMAHKLLGAIFK